MNRVIFASDLHARPDKPERERIFEYFLNKINLSCDILYLLGDIFEFGFVFRGKILPYYQRLVDDLAGLKDRGVEVYFLPGNHDLWMAEYLKKRGIGIIQDGEVVGIYGRRAQLFHGMLRLKDALSRFTDKIMRSAFGVHAYAQLPPGIGFNTALRIARASRERHHTFRKRIKGSDLRPVDPRAGIVISGHHHQPLSFTYDNRRYISLGDWIRNFTYLEMTPERLELKSFPVDSFLCK